MNINIHPELKNLMPPLTNEEKIALHESIISEGCRDAIIVWPKDELLYIIDGHNRYEICVEKNIDFNIIEMPFENIDDIKIWMIDNQSARRNLTDGWKWELTQVRKQILIKQGRNKLSEAGKEGRNIQLGGLSTIDKGPEHNTRKEIAQELGWSTGKVAMADKVWNNADDITKEKLKSGEITFNQIYNETKKKVYVSNNSGENEWYTPFNIIDSARTVMGNIDLDPASSESANNIVKAIKYYTIEDNGLEQPWFGNIWLNPPYSQPLVKYFANAVVSKINEYNQIMILVNNATETDWFQKMFLISDAVCFIKGRVKFIDKDGKSMGAPLQGQSILYIGVNIDRFKSEFNNIGICVSKI